MVSLGVKISMFAVSAAAKGRQLLVVSPSADEAY